MKTIVTDDIRTRLIPLPGTVKGYTISFIDGTFCIVLNERISYEQRYKAYQHELEHILNNDFDRNNIDIDNLENIRHNAS